MLRHTLCNRPLSLRVLALTLCLKLTAGAGSASGQAWKDSYQRAEVAAFYSASVLNGYYDVRLAQAYLDSCEMALRTAPPDGEEYAAALDRVIALRRELAVSSGIARENMNYRYPAFSLMAGHRPEFNDVDDTEELLVEAVVDRVINAPDPFVKGNLKDNTHFVLLSVEPYNDTLLTVGLDHLSSNTGSYGIRLHELAAILSPQGLARFREGAADSSDHRAIMKAYGIDRLVCIHVRDNGSQIPGLFYKGVTLRTVTMSEPQPRYVTYYESFKVDRTASWSMAVLLFALNTMVAVMVLLMLSMLRVERAPFRVSVFFSREMGFSLLLLVVGAVASVLCSYYLSKFIPTEINQFVGESGAIAWVLFQVFVPTLVCFGVCYLVLYKFSSDVVNSVPGFTRLIYVSFTFPALLIASFEYHAEMLPAGIGRYLMILQVLLFIPVAVLGGRTANALLKRESNGNAGPMVVVVCMGLWFLSFWFDLRDMHTACNVSMGSGAVIALMGLFRGNFIRRGDEARGMGLTGAGYGLMNPLSYIESGSNIRELREQVQGFLADDTRNVLLLSGEPGVGKTRFIRELMKAGFKDAVFYFGDCDEFPEGNSQLYEPFFNAFCQHDGVCGSLPKGFFVDRGGIGRGLTKVVKLAGAAAPLDVGSVLSLGEDSSRSVTEIAAELVDELVVRLARHGLERHVLVIDDCQWMDAGTRELLEVFLKQVRIRTKHARNFKIILVEDGQLPAGCPFGLWKSSQAAPPTEVRLQLTDGMAFVRELVSMEDFRIGEGRGDALGFAASLKAHLMETCEEEDRKRVDGRSASGAVSGGFTPGDVFGYLAALQGKGCLKVDGSMLRLSAIPEDVHLKGGRSEVMATAYRSLDAQDQLLLESAAHIGFKFDADILSSIWKRDVLDVLRQLERLHEAGFVIDLCDEDNLFSFQNKELHRIIRTDRKRTEDNDEGVRQLVVEYQKRIIETMVDRGDAYIRTMDLEMLQSAIQRCFKYARVDVIRKHTPLIGLYAALKYAQAGKTAKCADTLLHVHPFVETYSPGQVNLLVRILGKAIEQGDLERFDVPVAEGRGSLLDDLLRAARVGEQADQEVLAHLLLRDIQKRFRIAADKARTGSVAERAALARLQDRKDRISRSSRDFTDECNRLRVSFYLALIDNAPASSLSTMLLSALEKGFTDLAGELSRHLSLVSADQPEVQLRHATLSLLLLAGKQGDVRSPDDVALPTAQDINRTIAELLERENLRSRKANDLNFNISRFRDYFFNTGGDTDEGRQRYHHCIDLCDIGHDLSVRLNDERGREMAMSYKGAALFHLGRYRDSLDVYRQYFEWLVTRTKEKERFRYVIEGIGRNCQALNDPTPYEWLKKELYEHLLFVSKKMQEEPLRFSLFDKTERLKDVLPMAGTDEQADTKADMGSEAQRGKSVEHILEMLVCLAHADGRVDEGEIHDLTESAIALAYNLNLPHRLVQRMVDGVHRKVATMDPDDRTACFREAAEWLNSHESAQFTRAILQLCIDMVRADGVVTDAEQHLIDVALPVLDGKG